MEVNHEREQKAKSLYCNEISKKNSRKYKTRVSRNESSNRNMEYKVELVFSKRELIQIGQKYRMREDRLTKKIYNDGGNTTKPLLLTQDRNHRRICETF